MKFSGMRWLVVASLIGFGVAGVVSSNVGCGDSDATGSGGSGGGAGGSGGAVVPRYADTFDTDKEMWALSTYVDANYKNLGAASDPDSGVSLDGGMVPTLEWSGTSGDPSPGSLKLTVTFSGFKEYVDPQVNVATPVDFMTGGHKIVRARIRLVSGTFPSGGIQFHVSSGLIAPNSYVYVSAPSVTPPAWSWGRGRRSPSTPASSARPTAACSIRRRSSSSASSSPPAIRSRAAR